MYEKVTFSSPGRILHGRIDEGNRGRRNGERRTAAIYFGREFTYHVRCQRGRSWARLCFAVSRDQNYSQCHALHDSL